MIFFPLCLYFSPCVFIFSPCVFIFSLLAMQLIFLLSRAVYWRKIFFVYVFPPGHAVLYLIFILPFFLDSFLDMSLRRNNIIFSPLVQFFPTCDRKKLVKKINGGKKNGIFSHFHIFPPWTMLYLGPFSDSYGTKVHENVLKWLKCTFFCL